MRPEIFKYLYDIQQACRLLIEFTGGKTFDDYLRDPLLRSAVERQFMIIGEALMQACKIDPGFAEDIPDTRRIVNFRHVLVHGYATVEHGTVWGIVQKDLPILRRQTEKLLQQQPES